jgi:hypothetical protein
MAQQYHPKPISFVPPILKRKFIAPDNPKEMGTLVMLIGFAIIMVSAWSNVTDLLVSYGKKSAMGTRVAEAPFRSGNAQRMVGVYLFEDEAKVPAGVRGERVFTNKAKVPNQARVVWPRARPQKARVVFEYLDYLLALPIGFGVFGFGMWLKRKRVDAFDEAMGRSDDDETMETLR